MQHLVRRTRSSRMGLMRAFAAAIVATLFAGGALALAQSDDDASEPVLHEYVAPPSAATTPGQRAGAPIALGGDPRAGQNPTAVKDDGTLLPAPSPDAVRPPDEPVFGTDAFGADRETQARPDYGTGPDATLKYVEVYNPAVLPFKRMSALDAMTGDYVLGVRDPARREVPVGGAPRPDRDPFWGALTVELRGATPVALPSVAPDMRFLSYETQPPTELIFSKDGADNYFVEAADGRSGGQVRVVFLVDAPVRYFVPEIPRGLTVAGVAGAEGMPAVPPLTPRAQAAAAKVMAHIGVHPAMLVDEAVDRLVAYHRSFEAGLAPPQTDDIYRDLALSQRGVCRHRSFTFVVTAWALGLPARYVTNEAHAFVELWLPGGQGWARVDLGGAALNMDVAGADDKKLYRPDGDDPFPKPAEYEDGYTNLRGDIRGLSDEQLAAAHGDKDGHGSGNGNGPKRDGDGDSNGNGTSSDGSRSTAPLLPTPGEGLPAPPPSAYEGKTPMRVVVDGATPADALGGGAALRGHRAAVHGRLTSESGEPLAGAPVTIFLKPLDPQLGDARRVGAGVTDANGRFQVVVDLPPDLALGRHEVFGSYGGDVRHQPALSR